MKIRIVPNFFLIVMAVIIGSGLSKLFDFGNMTFEQPALAAVYLFALLLCFAFMIKRTKKE
jgi:hypothetical protein